MLKNNQIENIKNKAYTLTYEYMALNSHLEDLVVLFTLYRKYKINKVRYLDTLNLLLISTPYESIPIDINLKIRWAAICLTNGKKKQEKKWMATLTGKYPLIQEKTNERPPRLIKIYEFNKTKPRRSTYDKQKKRIDKNLGLRAAKKIERKVRDTRHFAPANKEWNNSVYTFNKSYLYDMGAKHEITNNSIRVHFSQTLLPERITKSKRMRDLLRRKSTRKLFVSRPEIKQTNDKAIVTVYLYDREKKEYLRKLFLLRRWLNKIQRDAQLKTNLYKQNKLIKKYVAYNKQYKRKFLRKKRISFNWRFFRYRHRRYITKRRIRKYRIKSDFYRKTVFMLLKKKRFFLNLVLFNFLRKVFKVYFGLRTEIREKDLFKRILYVTRRFKIKEKFIAILSKPTWLTWYTKETKKEKKKRHKWNREHEDKVHRKPKRVKKLKIKKKHSIKLLESINLKLLRILMSKTDISYSQLHVSYNNYKRKYGKYFVKMLLKKENLVFKYLSKLYLNKFKMYSLLPVLKSFLSKVYNKKIQFNLVNLRYLQLNSNMYSEAISIKLKDRTLSLSKIIRKSFNIIKPVKPKHKYITYQKEKNFPLTNIFTMFGKYNVINGNILNTVFNKMHNKNKPSTTLNIKQGSLVKKDNIRYSATGQLKNLTTIRGILKSIKYKWLTGARVEAKGRLTRRYAASRALFKYKYKGTLRNLEYLRNIENDRYSPNVSMLRSDIRPNSHYTLSHSKRRIGAFGIKAWMSYN